ncbi:glycosyltransferase family 2 protein [Polynucleobacter sp. 30F-ANTBAC]|uniref:glycosyltransferase family 2 protein n=1 Tax=Polynucleobacter sp. 30F-ANTBAC TaxID=2689095 RepID=UPI001C0B044E|nr:glycosyltransferase family 2 protein [Polynucleobacter sp. 30F-ANTBAC]MBU3599656.1 glycosyltransferase family 2 protein [Polynucleobacter sp. 30F-ANTBAC]
MENNSLISVLMPAYNVEKYISQAINSVLSQSYSNFELLIADDGSIDGTVRVIEGFTDSRIKLFHNNKNFGHVYTKNKLLSKASGDFITFLDADDFSSPDRLYRMLHEFLQHPELGLCSSNVVRVFGETYNYLPNLPESCEKIRIAGESAFPAPSAVMISKDIYLRIGGYRNFFDGMCYEDHDWISRIIEMFQSKIINHHLYFYRFNPTSIGNVKFDSRKLAARDIVNYLKQQRAVYGEDDLQAGRIDALSILYQKKLSYYSHKKWKYYIELRRLTELKSKVRFLIWARMFMFYPFSLATYKSLIRIVIPVRSKLECLLREGCIAFKSKHKLFTSSIQKSNRQ